MSDEDACLVGAARSGDRAAFATPRCWTRCGRGGGAGGETLDAGGIVEDLLARHGAGSAVRRRS